MFKNILVANRGEIACRVIATARRMTYLVMAGLATAGLGLALVAAALKRRIEI